MKHVKAVSKGQRPASAISLLQWQQLGVILGAFATALNGFVNAFGNLKDIFAEGE